MFNLNKKTLENLNEVEIGLEERNKIIKKVRDSFIMAENLKESTNTIATLEEKQSGKNFFVLTEEQLERIIKDKIVTTL